MNSQYPGLLLALDQPQRIIDSRTPYPSGIVSPLPIGTQVSPTSYNFRISGAVSTTGNTLPSNITAVQGIITASTPNDTGFLVVLPGNAIFRVGQGGTAISFQKDVTICNSFFSLLSPTGELKVVLFQPVRPTPNPNAQLHVVIDVVAYYTCDITVPLVSAS